MAVADVHWVGAADGGEELEVLADAEAPVDVPCALEHRADVLVDRSLIRGDVDAGDGRRAGGRRDEAE